MTLETSLELRACIYLRRIGANPVKRGQDGEPDRQVLWGNGLHFWIEFKKAETGKLRPGQKVMAKYLRGIGDEVHVVDSFEQVKDIVDDFTIFHGGATAFRDAVFK